MNELALFAGAGGGILGGQLLGWRTVCAVERDAYAAAILAQRQNEGFIDLFPIWSDITTFDGRPWQGIIDVISGGFPCQDISVAGKGAGIEGKRSGLWGEMARVINEIRPCFVFVENSPALTLRGLGRVLGDLAKMGYDAEWGVLAASDVGAPHKRERIWILGHTRSDGWDAQRNDHTEHDGTIPSTNGQKTGQMADTKGLHDGKCNTKKSKRQIQQSGICTCAKGMADTKGERIQRNWANGQQKPQTHAKQEIPLCDCPGKRRPNWTIEPDVGRMANGVEFRVDRLKALGNGQVPQCHAEAWRRLLARIKSGCNSMGNIN